MVEDAGIVRETRKVRCSISERFGNDPDRYIDYLMAQEDKAKPVLKPNDKSAEIDRRIGSTG
jgi:hypothetical protein